MPQTDQEIDDYLDLINLGKEYEDAFRTELLIGKKAMKKWGLKHPMKLKKKVKNYSNEK